MAKPRLNIAMIGYQFMGRAHSNAWRQVGRFFELPFEPVLKVVCGRNEAAVAAAAARLGFQEHATSWEPVVSRPEIDIVDICTPGDSHAAIAVAAAEARKVILCEKPLANSVAEAEQMLAAVEAAGVLNMVCHNYRRAPAVALARQWIQESRLGTLRHYRGTYLQDWIVDPAFPRVWRLERARAGSGALGDIASHSIDLARHLVGEIREVCGLLETFVKERPLAEGGGRGKVDVDDAALALLRFESGAIGSVEGSRFAPGRKNYNRFEINGSLGSVAFDLERMNEIQLYLEEGAGSGFRTILATDSEHPYAGAWWPPGHILGYEHTFVHTVLDLLRAIEAQSPASPDFREGVRNQRVLDAIERSHAARRWHAI
jgi:predicted dehydrogenase